MKVKKRLVSALLGFYLIGLLAGCDLKNNKINMDDSISKEYVVTASEENLIYVYIYADDGSYAESVTATLLSNENASEFFEFEEHSDFFISTTLDNGTYKITASRTGYGTESRIIKVDDSSSLYIVGITLSESVQQNPESVPEDAFEWNGHYYKVYSDVCDSWEEAREYCESLGGYLAVISSTEENDALYEYILSCGYDNVYFGYSDAETEGQWEWVSHEASDYENWGDTEPNSVYDDEDYAMFYYKYPNGGWNDDNFDMGERNFLCEWDLQG